MSIELKIKSKHLSEEARIIRFEERKLLKQLRWNIDKHNSTDANEEYPIRKDTSGRAYRNIRDHRVNDVRNENRATFLARAFLAGRTYESVENKRNCEHTFKWLIFPRFVSMVVKYSPPEMRKNITWNSKNRRLTATPEFLEELKTWANV